MPSPKDYQRIRDILDKPLTFLGHPGSYKQITPEQEKTLIAELEKELEKLKILEAQEPEKNHAYYHHGQTLLMHAAKYGAQFALMPLLHFRNNLFDQDAQGRTALQIAAHFNNIDFANTLIRCGANTAELPKNHQALHSPELDEKIPTPNPLPPTVYSDAEKPRDGAKRTFHSFLYQDKTEFNSSCIHNFLKLFLPTELHAKLVEKSIFDATQTTMHCLRTTPIEHIELTYTKILNNTDEPGINKNEFLHLVRLYGVSIHQEWVVSLREAEYIKLDQPEENKEEAPQVRPRR